MGSLIQYSEVVSRPAEYTVLAQCKVLALIKHVVIYGSEKAVNQAWHLGNKIKDLQDYNTVLMAISNPNSVSAFIQRLQGGSVDQGYPVRQAAGELHELLCSADRIRSLRSSCADPNSLVPVGDSKKAGFVSDDVRHAMLKEKMMREQGLIQKSNLKMAEGSFGSGFNSADGDRRVIGAAHSLEEMLAKAAREKSRFSDEGPNISDLERKEYIQQLQRDVQKETKALAATEDLLGISDSLFQAKPPFPYNSHQTGHPTFLDMGIHSKSFSNQPIDLLDLNFAPSPLENDTNYKPSYVKSNSFGFLSQPVMTPNTSASASAISELDLTSSVSSSRVIQNNQTIGPLQGIPPPPSLPPPPPPQQPSSLPSIPSTYSPSPIAPQNVNIDSLSPEQRSQYLQQLLIMNQQIMNMMMQASDKSK